MQLFTLQEAIQAVERFTRGILSEQDTEYVRVMDDIRARHSDVVAEAEGPRRDSQVGFEDEMKKLVGQIILNVPVAT